MGDDGVEVSGTPPHVAGPRLTWTFTRSREAEGGRLETLKEIQMGTIVLGAVIVTLCTYDEKAEEFQRRYQKIAELIRVGGFATTNCLTPICAGINGHLSFALLPCGSKYGWNEHDKWLEIRDQIVADFKTMQYCDIVTIKWGETDPEAQINDAVLGLV